jgi:hypothetical protein
LPSSKTPALPDARTPGPGAKNLGYVPATSRTRAAERLPAGVLDWFALKPGARSLPLYVRYRYRVGDLEYVSTQYRVGEGLTIGRGILGGSTYPPGKPLDHWKIGMPLVVHYHPRHPGLATIDTGIQSGTLVVFFLFTVGSVVVGALRLIALLLGF